VLKYDFSTIVERVFSRCFQLGTVALPCFRRLIQNLTGKKRTVSAQVVKFGPAKITTLTVSTATMATIDTQRRN